jgi:hypothetical protein
MGCEKELYNNESASELRKQPASNLREITELVKYICNDIERQNILGKYIQEFTSVGVKDRM